jgi:hypothetical protein
VNERGRVDDRDKAFERVEHNRKSKVGANCD